MPETLCGWLKQAFWKLLLGEKKNCCCSTMKQEICHHPVKENLNCSCPITVGCPRHHTQTSHPTSKPVAGNQFYYYVADKKRRCKLKKKELITIAKEPSLVVSITSSASCSCKRNTPTIIKTPDVKPSHSCDQSLLEIMNKIEHKMESLKRNPCQKKKFHDLKTGQHNIILKMTIMQQSSSGKDGKKLLTKKVHHSCSSISKSLSEEESFTCIKRESKYPSSRNCPHSPSSCSCKRNTPTTPNMKPCNSCQLELSEMLNNIETLEKNQCQQQNFDNLKTGKHKFTPKVTITQQSSPFEDAKNLAKNVHQSSSSIPKRLAEEEYFTCIKSESKYPNSRNSRYSSSPCSCKRNTPTTITTPDMKSCNSCDLELSEMLNKIQSIENKIESLETNQCQEQKIVDLKTGQHNFTQKMAIVQPKTTCDSSAVKCYCLQCTYGRYRRTLDQFFSCPYYRLKFK